LVRVDGLFSVVSATIPPPVSRQFYLFGVAQPNTIKGNKPIKIGYGKTPLRTAIFQLVYGLRQRRYCLQLDLRKIYANLFFLCPKSKNVKNCVRLPCFLTITILLTILSSLAYVAFQVGRNGQPLSMALEPLMGFLIFAGGATLAIGVMIGTSTTTTT
jgi:hypothetical protein